MRAEKNNAVETFCELSSVLLAKTCAGEMDYIIAESVRRNPWFTPESVRYSITSICTRMLTNEALSSWVSIYNFPAASGASRPWAAKGGSEVCGASASGDKEKRVGVIMAGNIPLVGFSDMLAVLVNGHKCLIKPSSKDFILTDYIIKEIRNIQPDIPVETVPELQRPDAVIATGNDNTIRTLKSKYGSIPSIFRGSRMSVAVISGNETAEDLSNLARDIFMHCGLGCRNVSHIFVPEGYDIKKLCTILSQYPMTNQKYINNYLQNKAVSELTKKQFTDGGFFTLAHSSEPSAFISEITYSGYSSFSEVCHWISANDNRIQCVVGLDPHEAIHPRKVGFGQTQAPALTDYPDGIDVMEFLANL